MENVIDIHAHYFPPAYLQFLGEQGLTGILAPARASPRHVPAPLPTKIPRIGKEHLDQRFMAMTQAGVGQQVLSPPTAPYLSDEAASVKGATMINDSYAALAAESDGRLAFWATLPLPHVEASLQELARGLDELGAVGVTMQCFCQNETIVRAEFEPLFAALEERRSVLFLHPCQNGLCSHLINEWGLTVCAGAAMEDSIVAMHLIAAQIPSRYPNLRIIVPHLGGILPMLLSRLDGQMPRAADAELPSVSARRLYYDTVGWGSNPALVAACMAFGDTQLGPGSDWPFLLEWESYTQTFDHIRNAGLPKASVDRILYGNAPKLLYDH